MIDVGVHEIGWCPCNGHPVLYLRVGDTGHGFGVAISPGDAQAMAARPAADGAERVRVYALLETTIVGLGARLAAVTLGLGPDRVMRAWLTLERPGGPLTLPAALPDGIVLARRARVPLRMAEADLERLAGLARPGSNPGSARGSAPDGAPTPPAPFRDLIESLDLDGLGAGSSPADDPC